MAKKDTAVRKRTIVLTVLALAVSTMPGWQAQPASAAGSPGGPVYDNGERLTYASGDGDTLLVGSSGYLLRPSLPDIGDASTSGRAVAWVTHRPNDGNTDPDFAEHDGEIVYWDGTNNPRPLTADLAIDRHPALSPDGKQIAFASDSGGSFDIWVINVDGSGRKRLTTSSAQDDWPTWSPDSKTIAFSSTRDDPAGDIYTIGADGGTVNRLTNSPGIDTEPAWSPDGNRIAFTTSRYRDAAHAPTDPLTQDYLGDIAIMPATGGTPSRPLPTTLDSGEAAWSPDGKILAFTTYGSDPAGDVYTADLATSPATVEAVHKDAGLPETNPAWRVNSDGAAEVVFTSVSSSSGNLFSAGFGTDVGHDRVNLTRSDGDPLDQPAYSRDGKQLAYVQHNGTQTDIYVADAQGRHPRKLTGATGGIHPAWSPDGSVIGYTQGGHIFFRAAADGALRGDIDAPEGVGTHSDDNLAWSYDGGMVTFDRTLDETPAPPPGSTPPPGGGFRTLVTRIWTATDDPANPGLINNQVRLNVPAGSPCANNIGSDPVYYYNFELAFIQGANICVIGSDGSNGVSLAGPDSSATISNLAMSQYGSTVAFAVSKAAPPHIASAPAVKHGYVAVPAASTAPIGTSVWFMGTSSGSTPRLEVNRAATPTFQAISGDIRVSGSASPQSATVGDTVTLTYQISNSSNLPALHLALTTNLPAGLSVQSVTAPGSTCETDGSTCFVGMLGSGQSKTVTVTATASKPLQSNTAASVQGDILDGSTYSTSYNVPILVLPASLDYRISYAAFDVNQLFYTTPGGGDATRLNPPNASVASDASAQGTALTWISRGIPDGQVGGIGTAYLGGTLYYAASATTTPVKLSTDAATYRHPALSPDGKQIAFSSDRSGNFNVWVINTDGTGLMRVTTGSNDDWPAWSPDGQTIAFSSTRTDPNGNIYTTPAAGGATTQLTTGPGVDIQPAYSPDGIRIAYATTQFRNNAAGGPTDVAIMPAIGGPGMRMTATMDSARPAWSPDGTKIAYASGKNDPAGDIFVLTLGSNAVQTVSARPSTAETNPTWWSPTAGADPNVLFTAVTGGEVGADIWSSKLTGNDQVDHTNRPVVDEAEPAYSTDGKRLAYTEYENGQDSRIVVANADGSGPKPLTDLGDPLVSDSSPTWSPDGTLVAFTRSRYVANDGGRQFADSWIVVMKVDPTPKVLLDRLPLPAGNVGATDADPAWSPTNASQLALSRTAARTDGPVQSNIWLTTLSVTTDKATVTNQRNVTASATGCTGPQNETPAWSPDGKQIAYTASSRFSEGPTLLCALATAGTAGRQVLSSNSNQPADPAWSPDGKYIAYTDYTGGATAAAAKKKNLATAKKTYTLATSPSPYQAIFLVDAVGTENPGLPALSTPGGASQPAFEPKAAPPANTVSLDISASPQPATVGGPDIAVKYTVFNNTDANALNTVVKTGLPAGLPVHSISPAAQCDPTGKTCQIGTIPAFGKVTFTINLTPALATQATASGHLTWNFVGGPSSSKDKSIPIVVTGPTTGSLKFNPTVGPPGLVPVVTGTGFKPNTDLTLQWDNGVKLPPAKVRTDNNGNFTVQLVVPYGDVKNQRKAVVTVVATNQVITPAQTPYQVGGIPDFPR